MVAGCLNEESDGALELKQWSTNGRIHVVQLDVTDEQSIQNCVKYAEKISKAGKKEFVTITCT